MKSKKSAIIVTALTLTLAVGTVTYAASGKSESNVTRQQEISTNGENKISLENPDKSNLPNGISYQSEISMDVNENSTFRLGE